MAYDIIKSINYYQTQIHLLTPMLSLKHQRLCKDYLTSNLGLRTSAFDLKHLHDTFYKCFFLSFFNLLQSFEEKCNTFF